MGLSHRRKPAWLKVPAPVTPGYLALRSLMREQGLHTVCESASCPNMGRCWQEGGAAFMILGNICTRRCAFCDVATGRPGPVDADEPRRLAGAVARMGLNYVVITSVDRDDLADGGAGQFAACIEALTAGGSDILVEVLTPDFRGKPGALERVLAAGPRVFNHNIETVPRLYASVRPAADYRFSLAQLARAGEWGRGVLTKSGIMVGLGERPEEVHAVLADLRRSGVTMLTIGQYLQPGRDHHPVVDYWPPERFELWKREALAMGFTHVESHPLARSSFHAERLYATPAGRSTNCES